jgi:hypothetical protein
MRKLLKVLILSFIFVAISFFLPQKTKAQCQCEYSYCQGYATTPCGSCPDFAPNCFWGMYFDNPAPGCTGGDSCQDPMHARTVQCSQCGGGYGYKPRGFVYCVVSCGGGGVPSPSGAWWINMLVDLNGNGVLDDFEAWGATPNAQWARQQPWATNFSWWDAYPAGWGGQFLSYLPRDDPNFHINSFILGETYQVCNASRVIFPVSKGPLTVTIYDPVLDAYKDSKYPGTFSCSVSGACDCGPVWNTELRRTTTDKPYVFGPKAGENWRIIRLLQCTGNGVLGVCELREDGKVYAAQLANNASTTLVLFVSVDPPSCTVDLTPASSQTEVGSSTTFTAVPTIEGGTIERVEFSSDDTLIATVNPSSVASPTYSTQATGVGVGLTTVTANVIMNGEVRCTDTANVSITPRDPWWQVRDSDVESGGDLVSPLPPGSIFGLDGAGGFPGVPIYSGSTSLNSSNVSSKSWLAESVFSSTKVFNYAYFARLIPPEVTFNEIVPSSIGGEVLSSGGVATDGVYWYHYSGATTGLDLDITSDITLGDRKVVLMVDSANLNLQGEVTLTDGTGFFGAYVGENALGVKGDINIDPSIGGVADEVPELEGLYLSDGVFHTGLGTTQLHVRGSIAAFGGISLERDLEVDETVPAEYFEYAPDQVMLLPSSLRVKKYKWQEVAP